MDYQIGLQPSIWVAAVAAVIVGAALMWILRHAVLEEATSVAQFVLALAGTGIAGVYFMGVAGLGVFCLTFAILNPLLQLEQLGLAVLEGELSNGVLALRVASIFVCYRTLGYIFQFMFVYEGDYFGRFFDRASRRYPELDELSQTLPDEGQDVVYLAQWGVYAMALTNLRLLTALPQDSILVAILSWGFFFVFDDWTITTEYARALKGRIFPWHAFRIHLFNVVLIAPLLILVFQQFSWPGAIISGTITAVLLFYRYLAWSSTNYSALR